MGPLEHLNTALRAYGLRQTQPGRWRGPADRRVDASRRRLRITWPMVGGPEQALSFWSRPLSGSDGPETGDLAFDGDIRIEGPESEVRRWMNASARALVRWLVLPGGSALRLRPDHLILLRPRWRPALFESLELLTHPRWNAAPDPARDPDPRVRALAALHLTRSGDEAALARVLEDGALPNWIRLEAAFALFRKGRDRGDHRLTLTTARRIEELRHGRHQAVGRLSLVEGTGNLGLPLEVDDLDGHSDN
ncbi:MAG: hypothetical protein AAGD10_12970 [Myxococcota bacterium]